MKDWKCSCLANEVYRSYRPLMVFLMEKQMPFSPLCFLRVNGVVVQYYNNKGPNKNENVIVYCPPNRPRSRSSSNIIVL
jgi:hypothetical protein